MKNISLTYTSFIFCAIALLSSCGSDDLVGIDEYIAENNLTTQVTSSGLHYIIHNPGTAPYPTASSTVTIKYKGYLLNGDEFDSNDNLTYPLSGFIVGWQQGLPLIGSGGSITLLLPPRLAYGSQGSGPIPPDASIGFDIELKSFQ
jgi:FKBP-type peptidyl-prolyl cis-trans isomerase FkpA